jgi:hypothetical protein
MGANVPQAWAVGSAFFFLQAILGLQPNTPENRLYVDPYCRTGYRISEPTCGLGSKGLTSGSDGTATRWDVLKEDPEMLSSRSFSTGRHLHP